MQKCHITGELNGCQSCALMRMKFPSCKQGQLPGPLGKGTQGIRVSNTASPGQGHTMECFEAWREPWHTSRQPCSNIGRRSCSLSYLSHQFLLPHRMPRLLSGGARNRLGTLTKANASSCRDAETRVTSATAHISRGEASTNDTRKGQGSRIFSGRHLHA